MEEEPSGGNVRATYGTWPSDTLPGGAVLSPPVFGGSLGVFTQNVSYGDELVRAGSGEGREYLSWETYISRVKSDVQGAQVAVVRGVLRDEGGVAIEVEGFVDAEGVEIGHDIAPTLVDAAYAWLELDFDSNGEVTLATIKAGEKWEGYPQAFTFDAAEPYRQTKYRKLLATIKMEAAVAPATEARMVLELEHVGGNLQLVMGYVYGRLVRMAINS